MSLRREQRGDTQTPQLVSGLVSAQAGYAGGGNTGEKAAKGGPIINALWILPTLALERVTPSKVLCQPIQAKKDASRFRALVLIGVAAAFRAAFIPHIMKPSVANRLAELDHPDLVGSEKVRS